MRASVRAMGNAERVRSCARSAEAWLARDTGRTSSRRCVPAGVPRAGRGSRRDRSRRGRRPRAASAAPARRKRRREVDAMRAFDCVEVQFVLAHQLRDDVAAQAVVGGEAHAARDREAARVDRRSIAGQVLARSARTRRRLCRSTTRRSRSDRNPPACCSPGNCDAACLLSARARVRRRAARSDPCRCTHSPRCVSRLDHALAESRVARRARAAWLRPSGAAS